MSWASSISVTAARSKLADRAMPIDAIVSIEVCALETEYPHLPIHFSLDSKSIQFLSNSIVLR